MKSKLTPASPPKIDRPVWTKPSSYLGVCDWSYRQWAWEFLRRNEEFEEATRRGRVRLPKVKAAIAAKFGRVSYKPYDEEYTRSDDDGRHWLPETVLTKLAWHDDVSEARPFADLRLGQVALVFDLSQTLRGGVTALNSLLDHARELLLNELEVYGQNFKEREVPRVRRIPRSSLFRLLRLHDAVVHSHASEELVLKELYRSHFRTYESATASELLRASKTMKRELRKAKMYVGGDYLALVPLDSIQERKTTRRSKTVIAKEISELSGPL
jgi:hypothetical protein